MLANLRSELAILPQILSIRANRSTFGYRNSVKYHKYHDRCRSAFVKSGKHRAVDPVLIAKATEFLDEGAAFVDNDHTKTVGAQIVERINSQPENLRWEADEAGNQINLRSDVLTSFPELRVLSEYVLEPFLNEFFGCNYKIFLSVMFKSVAFDDSPIGSQIWHSDGGPGTCVNIIYYPGGARAEQGAMELLPWSVSRKLLIGCARHVRRFLQRSPKASKADIRNLKAEYYAEQIDGKLNVTRPVSDNGAVLFFRNNCVHKGGFPEPGNERLAIIFHAYPHMDPPDYDDWFANGRPKTAPYPVDPHF